MACRTIFSRHFSTDFFFLSVFLFLIMLHSFFHSYDLFKQILIFLCLFSLLVCRFLYVYSFSNLPQPVPSDFTYTFSLFPFFFHCLLNSHQLYSFHPLPFLPTTSCVSALPPSFFYFHNGPSRFVIYFAAHLSSSSIFDFCFSLSSEIRHRTKRSILKSTLLSLSLSLSLSPSSLPLSLSLYLPPSLSLSIYIYARCGAKMFSV
ncbi:unnamed protein product [Acanthosepion pharaonis]|uniref:Uncharacterized protein n=1 Tax=Acanthosepion pharaonis TaxID=158019 RepID=A0A812BAJ2_ACAPH|nr:unnamed protein product [Sepia pharaonis]